MNPAFATVAQLALRARVKYFHICYATSASAENTLSMGSRRAFLRYNKLLGCENAVIYICPFHFNLRSSACHSRYYENIWQAFAEQLRTRGLLIDILPHVGVKESTVGLSTARLHVAAVMTRVHFRQLHIDDLK